MRHSLILSALTLFAATNLCANLCATQETKPLADDIEREQHLLAGWDPDEPVPANFYYKRGNTAMPVVIFLHGMGGNKDGSANRMKEWAALGMFVVTLDAHLHGQRRVPGIPPPSKNLGAMGTDPHIWYHQLSVSHTAKDVSKIIDALAARNDVDLTRIGIAGISMGSSTCMVLAWKEPRISVIVGIIGAVDFFWDMTKTAPGPEQDAKRAALSPRVKQVIASIDPNQEARKRAFAPKAILFLNGEKDEIEIESIRKFVKDLRPGYAAFPERLSLIEENVGHTVTDRMWTEASRWLTRHLIEKTPQKN